MSGFLSNRNLAKPASIASTWKWIRFRAKPSLSLSPRLRASRLDRAGPAGRPDCRAGPGLVHTVALRQELKAALGIDNGNVAASVHRITHIGGRGIYFISTNTSQEWSGELYSSSSDMADGERRRCHASFYHPGALHMD